MLCPYLIKVVLYFYTNIILLFSYLHTSLSCHVWFNQRGFGSIYTDRKHTQRIGGMHMNKFLKVYEFIGQVENFLSSFFFIVMVSIIFVAGFGRTIGYPIRWAMDTSTFLFAWAVFFSADIAMRKNRHVSVEILVNRLPKKIQNYIALLNYVIIVIFLAFLIIYGIKLCFITRFMFEPKFPRR